jgi:RNA polymerase sigma-70 factor (ECF subfamily)
MLRVLSDGCLIEEARAGNQAAFGELVHRYQAKLQTILTGMVQNPEDAQDLMQEVLIKAHRGLRQFGASATFYTWLYRIAVNTCIDFRRSSRRRLTPVSLSEEILADAGFEPADTRADADPHRVAVVRELQERVNAAIAELPEPFRTAVVLRDIEGRTQQEIAEIMQCPLGTVKTRIHRGRLELRRALAPYVEP